MEGEEDERRKKEERGGGNRCMYVCMVRVCVCVCVRARALHLLEDTGIQLNEVTVNGSKNRTEEKQGPRAFLAFWLCLSLGHFSPGIDCNGELVRVLHFRETTANR